MSKIKKDDMQIIFGKSDLPVEKMSGFTVCALDRLGMEMLGSCRLADWHEVTPVISILAVPEKHQRRGVASKLLEFCIAYSRNNDKEAISLVCRRDNAPAMALYRKFNFAVVWTTKDEYYMTHLLNAAVTSKTME